MVRVEWLRARAARDRWAEEGLLLTEELRRTAVAFGVEAVLAEDAGLKMLARSVPQDDSGLVVPPTADVDNTAVPPTAADKKPSPPPRPKPTLFELGFVAYAEKKRRMWMGMHSKSEQLHKTAKQKLTELASLPTLTEIVSQISLS